MSSGYYSPEGDNHQYVCPGGYSCLNGVLAKCASGQYSDDADINCNDCPVGLACPDPTNS